MPRESAAMKGRRYVTEGRLLLIEVTDQQIRARCRGNGAIHQLGHNGADGWWCSCPAVRTCAHLEALRLVTVVQGREVGR